MGQTSEHFLSAIADPVRMRLVGHLAGRESASVNELAQAAGVHANTARAHLAALQDAGVVERATVAPRGRGRPAVRYRLPAHHPPPGADFRALAQLLAAVLSRPGGRPAARLRAAAYDWGQRQLAARRASDHDLADDLTDLLGRLGFRARLTAGRLELRACPCPHIAPQHPETICALAHGATAGIASHAGYTVRSATHDPEHRHCTLTLG